ncbi:MAG: hypothetical protein HQK53_00205 [Oligoflexia bacterium]|nr:hypothetical protein [Oligoflexia bacterium]
MTYIDQWKFFLKTNHQYILDQCIKHIAPPIAGEIIYHIIHSQSWIDDLELEQRNEVSTIPYYINSEGITSSGKVVRKVTRFYRNKEVEFYYVLKNWSEDDRLESFFECYQFCQKCGFGDWNIPDTWGDLFSVWFRENDPLVKLDEYFYAHLKFDLYNFFKHQCFPGEIQGLSQRESSWDNYHYDYKNLWEYVCYNDIDDGTLCFYLDDLKEDLLDYFKNFSIKDLTSLYILNYKQHSKLIEEQAKAAKLKRDIQQKKYEEMMELGNSLIPEFKRKLKDRFDLCLMKEIRFAKDQPHWNELKSILDTFKPREQRAIIAISNCSNKIKEMYS